MSNARSLRVEYILNTAGYHRRGINTFYAEGDILRCEFINDADRDDFPTTKDMLSPDFDHKAFRHMYNTEPFQVTFHYRDNHSEVVPLPQKLSWEEIYPIYQGQFGISVSEPHGCFFLQSWKKGLYCCDLHTGEIRWHYKLKHAYHLYTYPDYLVCHFVDIGLRKLSYDGTELSVYPLTDSGSFFQLDDPYVFVGPKRNTYFIMDTTTMECVQKIRRNQISMEDSLILLDAHGNSEQIIVEGFEGECNEQSPHFFHEITVSSVKN